MSEPVTFSVIMQDGDVEIGLISALSQVITRYSPHLDDVQIARAVTWTYSRYVTPVTPESKE